MMTTGSKLTQQLLSHMLFGPSTNLKNLIIETTDLATQQSISIMENGVVAENMSHQG